MKQYIDLITKIIDQGIEKTDRTGTGTISIFGHQSEYDLREGFPLLTLKSAHWKSIVHENLWFLKGDTNTKYLKENGVKIWDAWADENGDLGPVYGKQWVDWTANDYSEIKIHTYGINQIQNAINQLKNNPDDRGIIVSAWNVGELEEMKLRPCHAFFQFYSELIPELERYKMFYEWAADNNVDVTGMTFEKASSHYNYPTRYVSLQLYQRSADVFLGVPFNIAGYSLLLHMISNDVNMIPKKFVHTFGDAHIYSNHKEQINTLLNRTRGKDEEEVDFFKIPFGVEQFIGNDMGPTLPELKLAKKDSIFDYTFDDIELIDYNHSGSIKAPVAI